MNFQTVKIFKIKCAKDLRDLVQEHGLKNLRWKIVDDIFGIPLNTIGEFNGVSEKFVMVTPSRRITDENIGKWDSLQYSDIEVLWNGKSRGGSHSHIIDAHHREMFKETMKRVVKLSQMDEGIQHLIIEKDIIEFHYNNTRYRITPRNILKHYDSIIEMLHPKIHIDSIEDVDYILGSFEDSDRLVTESNKEIRLIDLREMGQHINFIVYSLLYGTAVRIFRARENW